jgi:hypothetical protein
MVAKVRERLSISKSGAHKFHMEIFNLEELKSVEINSNRLKSQNKFAAFENVDDNVNINMTWESVRMNIKASFTECLG